MYQRILLAIDRDDSYQQALAEARYFAVSSGGILGIIYVHHDGDLDTRDAQAILQAASKAVGEGIVVETHLLESDPVYGVNGIAQAIACTAREWEADLLVLGSSGSCGLKRFMDDSVAGLVVNMIDISIMLVRPQLK
ncbi:MAG: universal stress protein [Thiohalomonadaceae bacterium]